MRLFYSFTGFGKGFIAGFLLAAIVFGLVLGFILQRQRVREIVEYAEKRAELQVIQEDVINRDSVEFFEVPGVRRAADDAAAKFERRRDEVLYRFRSRLVN